MKHLVESMPREYELVGTRKGEVLPGKGWGILTRTGVSKQARTCGGFGGGAGRDFFRLNGGGGN